MNFRVVVTPEASKDAEEASLWYEKQRNGLGIEFLFSIDATVNLIQRNPYQFSVIKKNYRRVVIQRFPFGIFYSVENDLIIIFSIRHHKRKPFGWLKRK